MSLKFNRGNIIFITKQIVSHLIEIMQSLYQWCELCFRVSQELLDYQV